MSKANSITKFSNSLTEFLINAMADKHGDARAQSYKYKNLKVYMDPQKIADPHFFVSIGISEACFSIEDGKKIEGSLGHEDGYVKRWAGRTNIQSELKAHWKIIKEALTAAEEDAEFTKKTGVQLRLRRAEQAEGQFEGDMTGTGLNKLKREEREKKRRFQGFKEILDSEKDK